MRKALRMSVLVMALAFSVSAGEMQNGVVSTAPPPPAITGEMQNGVISTLPPADTTATEVFLTLLQSVLALF
jgi:hypothetical protein